MELIVQQVYNAALATVSDNGNIFPPGFTFPWVHKGRFIRVPEYNDGWMSFAASTAFVKRNGHIVVLNSYGSRKLFQDPSLAGQYLAEV